MCISISEKPGLNFKGKHLGAIVLKVVVSKVYAKYTVESKIVLEFGYYIKFLRKEGGEEDK
jgi:hypothetical protein